VVDPVHPKIPKKAKIAADLLIARGATEVYLFGSHAEGRARPDSDIDLAIRGLPMANYFEVLGELFMKLKEEFDVVDLDSDDPYARFLETHGTMIRVA
jgi:predicted nucleotidyltransferase